MRSNHLIGNPRGLHGDQGNKKPSEQGNTIKKNCIQTLIDIRKNNIDEEPINTDVTFEEIHLFGIREEFISLRKNKNLN